MKVFLGGTCNESTWRNELIPLLELSNINYFNPVVDDWNDECFKEEIRQKEICDICLYTITPRATGVYSIAEVVDDSNKRPLKTRLCIIPSDIDSNGNKIEFDKGQLKSLQRVVEMVNNNGGKAIIANCVKGILQII